MPVHPGALRVADHPGPTRKLNARQSPAIDARTDVTSTKCPFYVELAAALPR